MNLGCSFADMVTGTESTLKQIALETAEKCVQSYLKPLQKVKFFLGLEKKRANNWRKKNNENNEGSYHTGCTLFQLNFFV